MQLGTPVRQHEKGGVLESLRGRKGVARALERMLGAGVLCGEAPSVLQTVTFPPRTHRFPAGSRRETEAGRSGLCRAGVWVGPEPLTRRTSCCLLLPASHLPPAPTLQRQFVSKVGELSQWPRA